MSSSSQPDQSPLDPAAVRRPGLFSITRTGVLLILVGHLLACVMVVVLMPGGWGWVSFETLVYRIMPMLIGGLILVALVKRTQPILAFAVETLRALWIGMAVFSFASFSPSLMKVAIGCLFVATLMAIAARMLRQREHWGLLAGRIVAAMVLCYVVFHTLRSPEPTTAPINGPGRTLSNLEPIRTSVTLDGNVRLDPTQANITFSNGRRFVQVEPLITFMQRSPDRTWTIFAPRAARRPPDREYLGLINANDNISAAYRDRDAALVVAEQHLYLSKEGERDIAIDARAAIPRPVFSHLNAFTQLTIAGHQRLSVEFSPVPGKRFDVPHAGYPIGAPATFAYVGADRQLHIVKASSGEKGPFEELGAGQVGESITLSFYDGDELVFEIEARDFAAQASTAPSPAAGWGVPQNAIEFGRLGEDPKSPATVYLTLAATSVGRGWSSVGYAAGMYQNRLIVRLPTNKPAD